MQRGELVPDALVIDMIAHELERAHRRFRDGRFPAHGRAGGGPRRAADAQRRRRSMRRCSSAAIAPRWSRGLPSRWTNPRNGRTYNALTNPPKVAGIDDEDGGELIQREDDRPETVAKRLDVYDLQTRPLIEYYRKVGKAGRGRRASQRQFRRRSDRRWDRSFDFVRHGCRARRQRELMVTLKSAREIEAMRRSGNDHVASADAT